jgi:acetylornithine deacetylase/succinyl-diaminopimelate desuccinylase-like protein
LEDSTNGRVLLPELHCSVPEHVVKAAQAVADEFGDVTAHELPALEGLELMGSSAADRILRRTWTPTLSVTGMGGIPAPEIAGNVLRPFTTATLSFRLPPLVDAEAAGEAVRRALTTNVPHHAKVDVTIDVADGWAAPDAQPWLRAALDAASASAFHQTPGYTGEGGTIPFLASLGKRYPGVQFVATGVLGPESNAHGIDEMLDLDTFVGVTNAVGIVLAAYSERPAP